MWKKPLNYIIIIIGGIICEPPLKKYIKTYSIYQRIKMPKYKFYKILNLLPTPNRFLKKIIINFIINLPSSWWKDGIYNLILIIINYYTKMV